MTAVNDSSPEDPTEEKRLDDALKKTRAQPKTAPRSAKEAREARLGAALRENLRRRKASRREDPLRKGKD